MSDATGFSAADMLFLMAIAMLLVLPLIGNRAVAEQKLKHAKERSKRD